MLAYQYPYKVPEVINPEEFLAEYIDKTSPYILREESAHYGLDLHYNNITMKILTEKDRREILEIISGPPITQEDLDNCPIMQESLRRRQEVAEKRSRDPEKFDAESLAKARALGIEIVDESHPWRKELRETHRRRREARKAQQESTVPVPATAKVLAE